MKYRFCVSARPTIRVQTLFQQQIHTIAMERAKEKKQDPNTIWTEGSKLGSGGVGVGIAWYEEMVKSEQVARSRLVGEGSARREREENGE